MAASRGAEYDDVEVVAVSRGSFDFLASWHTFFKPYHIIAIHLGDPTEKVSIPKNLNVDLYNRTDFERVLGRRAWIFGAVGEATETTTRAAASFGVLLAKRRFVFLLQEGCLVGKTPSGERINALHQHVQNLITPATPYFFNTLYDPYRAGSDFVRGYPFTLRPGVQTALSHGAQSLSHRHPLRLCLSPLTPRLPRSQCSLTHLPREHISQFETGKRACAAVSLAVARGGACFVIRRWVLVEGSRNDVQVMELGAI
jgi:hypothetical protein